MTAGQAIEQADEMRPNNEFSDTLKQNWLRQCDARLHSSVVQRSVCSDFDAVGADKAWADGLAYDTELLAPEEFGPLYTHWLCAQMDLALGETPGHERAADVQRLCAGVCCVDAAEVSPGGRGAVEVLT